jgi:sugar phosphate isomerase/epimerase
MRQMTRRSMLFQGAALAGAAAVLPRWAARAEAAGGVRVGTCVLGLEQAKAAGFDGVEVGAGGEAEVLDIAKPETVALYRAQMNATGLPVSSIMMGLFNGCPLASDPRAPAWLRQGVDGARGVGAKTVLLAFFGKGDLLAGERVNEEAALAAARRIKEAAGYARDAGVTLAIENYLSAEQNLRLLDRIGEEGVKLYYDVYNTGKTKKYDSPAEIRRLKGLIAQAHYKNGDEFLDADEAHFRGVSEALSEIGYRGWITLETSSPTKNPVADGKRNGDFVRRLFAKG